MVPRETAIRVSDGYDIGLMFASFDHNYLEQLNPSCRHPPAVFASLPALHTFFTNMVTQIPLLANQNPSRRHRSDKPLSHVGHIPSSAHSPY